MDSCRNTLRSFSTSRRAESFLPSPPLSAALPAAEDQALITSILQVRRDARERELQGERERWMKKKIQREQEKERDSRRRWRRRRKRGREKRETEKERERCRERWKERGMVAREKGRFSPCVVCSRARGGWRRRETAEGAADCMRPIKPCARTPSHACTYICIYICVCVCGHVCSGREGAG